jgi:hypothetical protein
VVAQGLPTEPEPLYADATLIGNIPEQETESSEYVNNLADEAALGLTSWWTGWWPLCHLSVTGSLNSGAIYMVQIAVDIIGSFVVEELEMETPADDQLSDSDLELMALDSHRRMAVQDHENILWDVFIANLEGTLFGISELALIAIDILTFTLTACPTTAQLTALYALQIVFAAAYIYALYMTWEGLLTCRNDAAAVLNSLFFGAAILAGDGVLACMSYTNIWGKYWSMRGAKYWGGRAKFYSLYSVFSIAIKVLLLGLTLGLMIRCVELWLQGY